MLPEPLLPADPLPTADGVVPADRADSALAALGVGAADLHAAVAAGEAGYRSATGNHPEGTAGMRAYQERVRMLRERLLPLGWERRSVRHLEFVADPRTSVAIGTMLGDSGTGLADRVPRNVHPRGRAGRAVIEVGAPHPDQLSLLDDLPEPVAADDPREVWYLLVHRVVEHDGAVVHRCELSLPGVVRGEYIASWRRRVLLAPVRSDAVDADPRPGGDTPVEIDVTER
ncbi:hypothetical protein [Nocardiopsis trehalosi]|uniref:hypothetical protein n=1 Tax=Nocardiopsis trehalosi TaxID=109329 RepID=UPI00082D3B2D|nr:hypothetical protein [Nocardiopsis trehalosi]